MTGVQTCALPIYCRLLMIMGAELLAYGIANEVAQLDEKCYFEVFQPKHPRPALKKKARV